MNELNYTCISIHAPPRGATVELSAITGLPYISIHAPPRGATIHPRHVLDPEQFQFTPLREGRLPAPEVADAPEGISIHAPPRGATSVGVSVLEIPTSFQFTPLREGRRLYPPIPLIHQMHFNSRPSARGDRRLSVSSLRLMSISIHAPPRGATLRQYNPLCLGCISIHAPPRGATRAS